MWYRIAKQNIDPNRLIDVAKISDDFYNNLTEPQIADLHQIPVGLARFIVKSWPGWKPVEAHILEEAWRKQVDAAPKQLNLPMGKLPPKTRKSNPERYFRNKLFHGTVRDNLQNIQRGGLHPDVGRFIREMYGDEYEKAFDDPEQEAVYMAQWPQIGHAIGAMQHAVSQKLNKDYHSVTPQEVARHGLLLTMPYNEQYYKRQEAGNATGWNEESRDFDGDEVSEPPVFSESGDVYSTQRVAPQGYYQGKKLQSLWKKWREKDPKNFPEI